MAKKDKDKNIEALLDSKKESEALSLAGESDVDESKEESADMTKKTVIKISNGTHRFNNFNKK